MILETRLPWCDPTLLLWSFLDDLGSVQDIIWSVLEALNKVWDAPEIVNSDAFNDGWFFKMQPDDLGELEALMSADDYAAFCDEED